MTALLLAAPSPAIAGSTSRADFELGLDSSRPGTPTGMTLTLRYKAPGAAEKPSPIRSLRIAGPPGLRFDTQAVPRCTAGDAELRVRGRAACPGESIVGTGRLTAVTGFGAGVDPVRTELTVFNGGDELIELVTFPGTGATAAIDRLRIDGESLTTQPPPTPGGPPDGQTAVSEILLRFPGPTVSTPAIVVAPSVCPESGRWTSSGTFGFADGATTTVTSTTPCEVTAAPRPKLTRRCVGGGRLRVRVERGAGARDVNFKFAKQLVLRDTDGPFEGVLPRRVLERTRATRLRAVVYLRTGGRVVLSRSLPRCGL